MLSAVVDQEIIFGRLPEKVNNYDRLGGHVSHAPCGGKFFVEIVGVDIESLAIDVNKHRCGTHHCHSLGGGEEGEVGHEDGIAGTDIQSHQRHRQGVGAVTTSDAMFHSHIVGQLLLQLRHLRTHDIGSAAGDTQQGFVHLGAHGLVLSM